MDELPSAPVRSRGAVIRNLAAGFGLLLPGRVSSDRFVRSFDQIALLLILDLLVWAGLDRLHAEPGAQLELDGLFGWAAYLLTGLLGAALIARVQSREANTRALFVPALSAAPFIMIVLWLLSDVAVVRSRPLLSIFAALIYLVFVGLRVLKAAYGWMRPRTVFFAIAVIVATPFVLDEFGLDTSLWLVADQQPAQDDEDSTATEELLYDQPSRIAAAVERLAPRPQDKPGVFFVGFAGVGEQEVFKREALFAQQVFADRFGSGERSIELINDEDDRDSYPLASVSGLAQAVRLVASRMDVDEDVLVLMLTSHGSQDGLAVTNGLLPLRQLGPADLQQVLDTSGIRWRIVIVSACYSGIFVDSLKNDTTVVITAADAEHTSFGCDDSRDLTWFGEAFLHDSLPSEATLDDAFKKASALIKARETAEHQIHSNPQLFIGDLMRRKLATLALDPQRPAPPRTRSSGTRTASVTIP